MGGSYSSGTAGTSLTYTNSARFQLDTSSLSGELKVGLLNLQYTGSGFDSLSFDIIESGVITSELDYTFSSLSMAQIFFRDDVIDLGSVSNLGSGDLDLTFNFALTGNALGQGFNTDFLFATVSPSSTAAPEPAPPLLLAFGLVLIVLGRLRARGLQLKRRRM
jgi:hypothetical protein